MVPFELTVEELKKMRDEGTPHQLIDCRRADEFSFSNIGGTLVEMETIPDHLHDFTEDTPLVVMCRTGARSARVAQYLRQNGFPNAQNLQGGIYAWSERIDPEVKLY